MNVSQLIGPREAWVRACTKSYFEARSKSGNYKNLIRVIHPHPDSIRIQSKVRDLAVNHNGTKLYVVTREMVTVLSITNNNQYNPSNINYANDNVALITKCTIPIKASKILVHPEDPDVFILLCQDNNSDAPLIRAYESKVNTRVLAEWNVKDADTWYTGAWSPNNNFLIFIDRQNRLYMMNLSYHIENSPLPVYVKSLNSEVYGITFSRKGDCIFLYGSEGYIECFPSYSSKCTSQILPKHLLLEPLTITRAHSHIVTCCATNKSNNLIATGGSDHTIHIFEINYTATNTISGDLVCIGTFPELEGQISNMSFSRCGLLLAWGTKDSTQFDDSDERDDETANDFTLTIAGVNPCQIYYKHPTSSPVTHCVFLPNSYTVIFALDYDYMKKGLPKGPKCPIGLLHLE